MNMQNSKGVASDDVLPDGTKVKKGGLVTYASYVQGRMTHLWGEDALEFKPERFLKDGKFVPESPFKFSAFQVRLTVQASGPYCIILIPEIK